MMMKTASLRISLRVVCVAVASVACLAGAIAAPAQASSTTTSTSTTTTTTTTTTTSPATTGSQGLIIDGPSRSECLAPNVIGTGLGALQSAISKFDAITNTSVSCVSAYLNGAKTWAAWEHPWIAEPQFGYTAWVAAAPRNRELVLQVDLIPTSLKSIKDPLGWERSCAAGHFDARAAQLGVSLVSAGLQNSVIRLGAEMNGNWENDFVGTTALEHRYWLRCFANEVTGLRKAVGGHFLIDWNPNPCQYNLPYATLYPGNSYVNIMGLDLFDVSCVAPTTPYSFVRLENEPEGLTSLESFSKEHHKPLSLPEWGLATTPAGDDPSFIDGIGSVFDTRDFAFETYFDVPGTRGEALPLGTRTPLSIPAFQRWFGNGGKP